MSANVDQRSKGQPSQVSNGNGKDVMKEEDPYLQQAPIHPVRSWSDQASDGAYGAAPMPTAGVSDSFFNYYAPNMSYPFMSPGVGGSEASWSNSADSMFSMGYDYSNVYSGFGFPFNNWEYSNDYWSGTQPVRKDQRGYAEDAYYPQEMIPTDSYGMMNGAAPPPEPQEPIGTVEQGLRGMSLAPPASAAMDSRKKMVDISQPPIMTDGFGGGDPSLMMPPPMPSNSAPGVISGGSGGSNQSSSKKTSWAAIASQPARPQQQMRPRTIPRAPVHPNKSMDIGTWDTRGNPAKSPMPMTQTLPSQPPPPRQSWATNSTRSRQIQPHSTSGPGNVTGPSSGSSSNNNSSSNNVNSNTNSTTNSSSSNATSNNNSNSNNSNNVVTPASSSGNMSGGGGHPSSYASYPSSTGNTVGSNRNAVSSSSSNNSNVTNGSPGDPQMSAISAMSPANPIVDQLKSSNLYNPKEFNLNPKSARFFVIKSYSEDDIHRSIKYNIWCSTEHGNKRLDQAFREREGKGPVYLIYSVNGSGHFCGIAQMMSPVDYNKSAGVWAQDKWKGQFEVKWVYVKDVPNNQLRHIQLENNENKPVTNSRDTQEVPPEKGKQVLRIMHSFKHLTSIFDDFIHYEKRQEEDQHPPAPHHPPQHQSQQHSMHRDNHRGDHHSGHNNHRDFRGGDHDRDSYHRNDNYRNDGRGDSRGDHRYDNRVGDYRGGSREHRGGFDRDHRDRGDGRNQRDNRRGGRQN